MDNGKLQLFNYSRSLITNRGAVKRGKIHSVRAMKQYTQTWRAASKRGGPGKKKVSNEVVYNQPAGVDRHVDRLTDSVNMISNVQMTPWHWYSVQGQLK